MKDENNIEPAKKELPFAVFIGSKSSNNESTDVFNVFTDIISDRIKKMLN